MINRTLLTVVLLSAGLASAQATRVWISGVGDDANPCSRTAPCLTLAGALAKVAAGGEIDVLDPAELGEVSITKSVTIVADELGGVTAPATGASVVIASPTATVHLRGVHFIAASSGVPAVRVLDASSVSIENCDFSGFTDSAVSVSGSGGSLFIDGSHFRGDNLGGVLVNTAGTQNTVITNSTFFGHSTAVDATGPVRITVTDSNFSANSDAAIRVSGGAQVNLERGEIVDSSIGADSLDGVIRLSNSQLSGLSATTHTVGGAVVHSFGNNRIIPDTCAIASVPSLVWTVGVPLTPAKFEGIGLLGDVTWNTTLPPGVTVSGGVRAGTPAAVTHVTDPLTATDQRGCTASTPFDLSIVCPSMLTLYPTTLSPVVTGTDITPVQFELQGSTSTITSTTIGGALPLGLVSVDGGLVGMPTEPGSFSLTVTGVDSFGCGTAEQVTLTVNASSTYQATTLTLTAATPAYAETSTTLTATLGAFTGTPTGFVKFYDGTVELGSMPISGGAAALPVDTLSAGTHSLTATYLGDATFGGSRAPAISLDVTLIPTTTSIEVDGSSLIASVFSSVAAPSGQVVFTVDGTAQAAVPVNGAGEAIISVPTALGMHTASAHFVENTRFTASDSTALTFNVAADAGMMDSDAGTTGGGSGSDGGTNGGDTPKTGCGCNQADLGAVLLAALALFRRRARVI